MDEDDRYKPHSSTTNLSPNNSLPHQNAINALILDYYKKFGRKRDLEQYFTAQTDIQDPSSGFWKNIKSQEDSSDSGEKKSESSTEICRISITCSVPEPQQGSDRNLKSDSESPPIISEEVQIEELDTSKHDNETVKSDNESVNKSDNESAKSDGNQSQESMDATLDTSMNKPQSPTSSITFHRKLEWDSLADVGYANESDRKTSASSLSTLERLALKQQYSNSQDNIGQPTAQSTPVEQDNKSKGKKGLVKKTMIYRKDVDVVELNVPQQSDTNSAPSINVNLTKHISFHVEKDGGVKIEDLKRDVSVNSSPDKPVPIAVPVSISTEITPLVTTDKEIQTSTIKLKEKSDSSERNKPSPNFPMYGAAIPVLINLNTLKRRHRKRKLRSAKRKIRSKRKLECDKENIPVNEKSGEQVSEAESFEYMPGHIYNQNQLKNESFRSGLTAGNKSSLESSAVTTDSSKGSKLSFSKDLEKGIDLLKTALDKRYDDNKLKTKLVKEVVTRLIKSNYKDDDSSTDFLSGLSFNSKTLGMSKSDYTTTTSTSDPNNTEAKKPPRPKKSILRMEHSVPKAVASTSQSAPNLSSVSKTEKIKTNTRTFTSLHTDSENSSKEKNSSDGVSAKKTSKELYLQYVEALKKEQTYKKYLKAKETFVKQKLASADPAKIPLELETKTKNRLKDLMNDLIRNNYDDGSGDASRLEGILRPDNDINIGQRKYRSHSVFTLSSGKAGNNAGVCRGLVTHNPQYSNCPNHPQTANIRVNCDNAVQTNLNNNCTEYNSAYTSRSWPYGQNVCEVQNQNIRLEKLQPTMPSFRTGSPQPSKPISAKCNCHQTKAPPAYKTCKCNGPSSPCNFSSQACGPSFKSRSNSPCSPRPTSPCSPKMKYTCAASPKKTIVCRPQPCTSKTHIKYDSSSSSSNNICASRKPSKTSQTDFNICMINPSRKSSGKSTCSSEKSCSANKVIHETVRCVQTEICIDPKISDPSISDIVHINDRDCVKIVKEQCRQISVKKDSSSCSKSSEGSTSLCTKAKVITRDCGTGDSQCLDNEVSYCQQKSSIGIQYETEDERSVEASGQYTIPIKGTNMMLMVNIGKNTNQYTSQDNKFSVNQGVCTNKVSLFEKNTCIIEECSKSVQCDIENSLKKKCPKCQAQIDDCSCKTSCNSPKKCSKCKQVFESCLCGRIETPQNCSRCQNITINCCCERKQRNSSKKCITCKQIYEYCSCDINSPHNQNVQCSICLNERDNCSCERTKRKIPKKCSSCQRDSDSCSCNSDQNNKNVCSGLTSQICSFCKKAYCDCTCDDKTSNAGLTCDDFMFDLPKSCQDSGSYASDDKIQNTRLYKETRFVNSCLSQCNSTFPRSKIAEQQATNSGILKKCLSIQTDPICCKDADTQKESNFCQEKQTETEVCCSSNEAILDVIRDITKRYSKTELKKGKKNKCFKELMTVLNYLLDTEDGTDPERVKEMVSCCSKETESSKVSCKKISKSTSSCKTSLTTTCEGGSGKKKTTDKGITTNECCNKPKAKQICQCSHQVSPCDRHASPCSRQASPCGRQASPCARQVSPCGRACSPTKKQIDRATCTQQCKKNTSRQSCNISPTRACQKQVDKGMCSKDCTNKSTNVCGTSSDLATTDAFGTSSDSATCKVLNRIKKECEKYHQKRCKCRMGQACDHSTSTSVACDECKRIHHCPCKNNRCKGHRSKIITEKSKNKCVAYNLIIQTSDSMISEESPHQVQCRQLKNVIIKAPSKCKDNIPFKEMATKIEEKQYCRKGPSYVKIKKLHRSRSWPYDSDSGEFNKTNCFTIRDYLEKNRPDFIENTSERQNCLKHSSNSRANERAMQRKLLSLQLQQQSSLRSISESELRQLAEEIGVNLKRRKEAPKFTSERAMKKHSEKIYKQLPEVKQKKDDVRKENIKKTNLLMANIFKRNLQKKTLCGLVNSSNYSTIIKI